MSEQGAIPTRTMDDTGVHWLALWQQDAAYGLRVVEYVYVLALRFGPVEVRP
jgi:hypothetical protein